MEFLKYLKTAPGNRPFKGRSCNDRIIKSAYPVPAILTDLAARFLKWRHLDRRCQLVNPAIHCPVDFLPDLRYHPVFPVVLLQEDFLPDLRCRNRFLC